MPAGDPNFWRYILPTSIMVVAGVSIRDLCITSIMFEFTPTNVKLSCGSPINTIL